MGFERKKRNLTTIPITSPVGSSSGYYRQQGPTPNPYAMTNVRNPNRTPSPPASAYFPLLSGDANAQLRPTPDADIHFAYSTTLRRHHSDGAALTSPGHFAAAVEAEATSLWKRALLTVTGQPLPETPGLENGLPTTRPADPRPPPSAGTLQDEKKDTISAKFAHYSVADTVAWYRTNATTGLLHSDIAHLRGQHGYNEFSVAAPEPLYLKFLKTIYESPLILLLCGSATVSAIMGNVDDAISITVAVLIVLTVGFVQERRSEKSLEALNKLVPHHCHVIRQGETLHVLANEIVPGDLVRFSTGDRIPADIRIVDAADLEIDESSFTGETTARRKFSEPCAYADGGSVDGIPGQSVALADRSCIAYMGTLVRNGHGSGIVIATGEETEFGVIFSMMQEVEERRTPLQLSMDELAKRLSILSFGIIGIICLIGVLQQRSWLDMFTIGVSLAVAAIPEGLPIVTTVTLALGVLRMAKRKAIVKKLHSVEALGSVSVVCSDKTGTLTKNEQTVTEAYAVDETIYLDPSSATQYTGTISPAMKTLEIGALCNNALVERNEEGLFVGQSTDVALLNVLHLVGITDRRASFKRTSEKPFNSEQKYMAVSGIHMDSTFSSSSEHLRPPNGTINANSREMYYIKGSIEIILDRCKFYYVNEESTPGLDEETRKAIMTKAQSTASRGLRVIAMAYGYGNIDSFHNSSRSVSRASSPIHTHGGEKDHLVFVGFAAMVDPPRKGVADSVGLLQAGGVHVVMITGDAEHTALAIAKDIGFRVGRQLHPLEGAGQRYSGVLTGKAIDRLSKAQLKEIVGGISVFARTTPKHKMRIVEAFQSRGAVVAMTGDGVNDAPALKMADIGLSMGKSGTDVAKEAADAILVDDNFSTILPAIEEGKSIFHNIQNFLSFQLSTAAAALTLITLSTLLGLDNPLNAMQILFVNILMDGPPSQSLGVDPVDPARVADCDGNVIHLYVCIGGFGCVETRTDDDVHMFCVPGSGVGSAESGAWVWVVAEQDAGGDGGDIGINAAGAGVCTVFAGDFPDGGASGTGHGSDYGYCWE
ncbi:hypothetical protein Agabi119p4_2136 [Agaricus bisporus var. burnettii]|uniref:P-type Ca(2+) transporter n=1 Tax=Agaricus bisporus var. burnettii TaxID=192524 RepID=A0A8H7KK37_AGABI|nr:hypothetical protein Agabi119p4_2136 [Agaricus bisporus var. burnettii]